MTKFIVTALVLAACIAMATVQGQYTTDIKCSSLDECICKLPIVIGAVAGRKASANVRNPVTGQTYAVDLSKPSQAINDYCNQLKRGLKPALPFAPPVDTSKLAQVQALLNLRARG
ncbi:uncharacterized protein LOC125948949 [Anopheles darlingi]|uniref:uncharacterized protein LOC125948949 n=1 Tax=Anopheles darlingi TaxID=43151 RepID=UPI0021003DE7|nr:uncharacterized protein LOC125948949 [Anopheles darlingi]